MIERLFMKDGSFRSPSDASESRSHEHPPVDFAFINEADRKMYDIPGFEPIEQKDVETYQQSRERYLRRIPEKIQQGLKQPDDKTRLQCADMIVMLPLEERTQIIRDGLLSQEVSTRAAVATAIHHAPVHERAQLIQMALHDLDVTVRFSAVSELFCVPEEDRFVLQEQVPSVIEQGLNDASPSIRVAAIKLINRFDPVRKTVYVERAKQDRDFDVRYSIVTCQPSLIHPQTPEERVWLYKLAEEGLQKDDVTAVGVLRFIQAFTDTEKVRLLFLALRHPKGVVRVNTMMVVYEIGDPHERVALFHAFLHEPEVRRRAKAVDMLYILPEDERQPVVERLLEDPDAYVREQAMANIGILPIAAQENLKQHFAKQAESYASDASSLKRMQALDWLLWVRPSKRTDLVRQAMEDQDSQVTYTAATKLRLVSEEQRSSLIVQALKHADVKTRFVACEWINTLPQSQQEAFRKQIPDIVRQMMKDESLNAQQQLQLMRLIPEAPVAEQSDLFVMGLEHPTFTTETRTVLKMVGISSDDLLGEKGLRTLATTTPLYKKTPDVFFRRPFSKTGSGTTLLGTREKEHTKNPADTLKGKVIMRHIPFRAYETWRQLFEMPDFWKAKGFSYVPIETIVRVQHDPKRPGDVAVSAKVLGTSVQNWMDHTPKFRREIGEQRDRIIFALDELGVTHGHAHDDNFCLVFEKEANGQPDLNHPPRVYLIDFDEAISVR